MDLTAGHREGLDFKLHDFGGRGVSSSESAMLGSAAHLMNFMGTDTFEALEYVSNLYPDSEMVGYSVAALEHSTVTSFGEDREVEAYQKAIDYLKDKVNTIVSAVTDSYDHYNAVRYIIGELLKEQIIEAGKHGNKFVVRPDSGDPQIIVLDTLDMLGEKFGYTINSKGYKVLPPYIGVLQGDGINETSIRQILAQMMLAGWSAENIVFGMGGALLQGVNRDTLKFAMKASAAKLQGSNDWYSIVKNPKTDQGKKSFGGRHAVINRNGKYERIDEENISNGYLLETYPNLLEDAYVLSPNVSGRYRRTTPSYQTIRDRVNQAL